MEPDDFPPPDRGRALALLIREDLDPLSVDELAARIAALEEEIVRCRALGHQPCIERRDHPPGEPFLPGERRPPC